MSSPHPRVSPETMPGRSALPLPNGVPKPPVPFSLPPDVHHDLSALSQWVCYKLILREDGKLDKIPYDAKTGQMASWTEPAAWSDLQSATPAVKKFKLDGVGLVLTDNDPYTAVDLDKCRNPETGEIKPWAREIVHLLYSYSEISPSGTGVHIFVRGTMEIRRRQG
jgi:putative DNA primase/helicase